MVTGKKTALFPTSKRHLASVLAVVDQVVDHRWVCKRGSIAQIGEIVFGDFSQNAPHDFTRACFRQAWRKLDKVGRGDRADILADPFAQVRSQIIVATQAGVQRHIAVNTLPLYRADSQPPPPRRLYVPPVRFQLPPFPAVAGYSSTSSTRPVIQ